MTPAEIKAECERLEAVITAKGYYMPKVTVYLNWIGYEITVNVSWRTSAHSLSQDKFLHGKCEEGFDGMLGQADDFVATMKSIADAQRDAFIAAVGRLIEQGRDIGMEVEFLNPLTAMMSKLSTNIITHTPE